MARWSGDITYKFVQEYLKHECLWDFRDSSYKNRQLREAAYEAIEKAMNLEDFGKREIAQKIKNVRSTYSQELSKIKSQKSGKQDNYIPSLKWFSLLDNKLKFVKYKNKTSTTTTTTEDSNYQLQEEATRPTSNEIAPTRIRIELPAQPTMQLYEASRNRTVHSPYQELSYPSPTIKKPQKKEKLGEFSSVLSQIKELSTIVNNDPSENEFDIFGRHVAVQLKSLPLTMAIKAQQQIQTVLTDYRLAQCRQNAEESHQYTQTIKMSSSPETNQILDASEYPQSTNDCLDPVCIDPKCRT